MKNTISLVVLMCLTLKLIGQHIAYTSSGNTMEFERVYNTLQFQNKVSDKKRLPPNQSPVAVGPAGAILAIAGAATKWGFKFASGIIEKNKEKFKNEFSASSVDINAQWTLIPNIVFSRSGIKNYTGNKSDSIYNIIKFELTPKEVGPKAFYYELNELHINYSDAKLSKKNQLFDLTIEVELIGADSLGVQTTHKAGIYSVLYNGTDGRKSIPIQMTSILLPRKIAVVSASIKVSETNSEKISYDKYLTSLFSSAEEFGALFTTISESIGDKKAD